MDMCQERLYFLTIRSPVSPQGFQSMAIVESRLESKYELQIMPGSSFIDSESASAFRREREAGGTNSCVQVLKEMIHQRSSAGGCLFLG